METDFSTFVSNIVSSFLGANKETPVVTPLMEYVRQKRAVDSGVQVMILGLLLCHILDSPGCI